jgi:virulence factor Mce-like protein
MRRAILIVFVLAAAGAFVITNGGAGGKNDTRHFTVELDNAFGLVEGADLKIAGVRAGSIEKLRLDRKTNHALVDFTIDKTGFGSLRSDVFCETRPQSLIGEYFIDCRPGTKGEELASGATIPVERTATTIPGDLVNDILRRPYRERLRIILAQLGAGVGARGETLNEAIRRASPALRETDQVLAVLGRQNQILKNLVTNADTVLDDLAGNRRDVTRWVREARGTAAASAERRQQIAEGLNKLPGFLEQLEPTMAELGRAADAQTPTLVDLSASADRLEHLFTQLEPFSKSTQVNLRSLGEAAKVGRPALKAAEPVVDQLAAFTKDAPELANNLDIVLHDLDDRGRAVEKDPRSPGGQGYTGFEALLQYVFNQSMSINLFDSHGYMLKANLFVSECSDYQNADSLKAKLANDPEFIKRCGSYLGPNQQGITVPDPTKPADAAPTKRATKKRKKTRRDGKGAEAAPELPRDEGKPAPTQLGETIKDLLDGKVPDVKLPDLGLPSTPVPVPDAGGDAGGVTSGGDPRTDLLDYLLGP